MANENLTNFELVRQWMIDAGQEVPEKARIMEAEIGSLRRKLISEEYQETMMAMDEHDVHRFREGPDSDYTRKAAVNLAKELADILVVVYGALVAMGVDGDKVFRAVMDNNDRKLSNMMHRPDGKVIVPPEVKAELKQQVYNELRLIIYGLDIQPEVTETASGDGENVQDTAE